MSELRFVRLGFGDEAVEYQQAWQKQRDIHAARFADEVFRVMRHGEARTTDTGQRVVLPPTPRPKQTFHLAAECTITALTVNPGTSSASVLGAPASISPTTPVTFVYDNDRLLWTRW